MDLANTAMTASDKHHPGILRLPTELRNKIYGLLQDVSSPGKLNFRFEAHYETFDADGDVLIPLPERLRGPTQPALEGTLYVGKTETLSEGSYPGWWMNTPPWTAAASYMRRVSVYYVMPRALNHLRELYGQPPKCPALHVRTLQDKLEIGPSEDFPWYCFSFQNMVAGGMPTSNSDAPKVIASLLKWMEQYMAPVLRVRFGRLDPVALIGLQALLDRCQSAHPMLQDHDW